jgi:dienelactone hydrolase
MKTPIYFTLFMALIFSCAQTSSDVVSNIQTETSSSKETISFPSKDGLEITADVYFTGDESKPWILLCHQARWSRGEYNEIAPKLNALGFNCLATDQRSGKEVNGVTNETAARARAKELGTEYLDAVPDIEAAIEWLEGNKKPTRFVLWGSSYSSTLAFVMAAKYQTELDAVMSFAPGDYFTIEEKSIADYSSEIKCPVFITSAKKEESQWQGIYKAITSEKSFYLPKGEGKHGASALWEATEGHEGYWAAVTEFLKSL